MIRTVKIVIKTIFLLTKIIF